MIGDGKGYDVSGSGRRVDIPIFNETTYQAISTTFPFIEESERQPYIVEMKFMEDDETTNTSSKNLYGNTGKPSVKISMPIIGQMATLINAQGLAFRVLTDGDRIRIYLGKVLKGKGNRYDEHGNLKSDTGHVIDGSNFMNGFSDMVRTIKDSGDGLLEEMTLGVKTWTFTPTIGVYFEFMMYYDPDSSIQNKFEFTGGGGYFGCTLDLRFIFYFIVYGVPCFVGGDVNISLVAEFGVGVNPNYKIRYEDPTQSLMDQILEKGYFDFLFRATVIASAYAGVGVAGTIGVRGGFQLNMLFIYNPFIDEKFDGVRPVGFSVTGGIKIWIDAALVHIPVPVYDWPKPYKLGYFEDIGKVVPKANDENSSNSIEVNQELIPRPRFGNDSVFVANDSDSDLYGGTYERESSRTLISGVYDAAEPKIIKYADDKALLVYLDDDHSRSSFDRTVLRYMIYDATTDTWTNPQDVVSNNQTADFTPNLCDCGDKILLSWASRENTVDDDVARKELLENMEIYAVFFDKATSSFENVIKITNDDSYDYYPKASYDEESDMIHLYYLKKQNVANINTGEDMLNQVQSEVNGAQLMYMIYDDLGDGLGERWLTDYYYDYEISNVEENERDEFVAAWGGQRFKNLSINIGGTTPIINNPNISDFEVATTKIFDTTDVQAEIANVKSIVSGVANIPANGSAAVQTAINTFKMVNSTRNKMYDVLCYVVEEDGNVNTKDDTDIYLKIHAATESETKTIRITNNSVSDIMPKIVSAGDRAYLFWIQNESMIKMVALNEVIEKSILEDHSTNDMKSGEISIITTDKIILSDKLNNIYPFTDENNNIYVVWQQDSNGIENVYANNEIEFKQDLYVSGLIETVDAEGDIVRSWSNPVRFTDNGKLNDLPTAISINNKLLLIDNQYNLKSDGDLYNITNSNLEAIYYVKKSSVKITSIETVVDRIESDNSIRYKTIIGVGNVGLYAANGFDYQGTITYDGRVLANISGGLDEQILPGGTTIIGGSGITASSSETTPPIYFTLTDEEQHHLDKIKLELNIVERDIGDSGITEVKDVFSVDEKFAFAVDKDDTNLAYDGKLKVEQVGEDFNISGILMNIGNIDSNGNEKIYVINQDDW
ncbi:MAG: hypothetical protein IJ593_10115, partial [Lachnospiraceae bacterium]|nr:hypothetical protein [Lachnospiraceae bacterium]